MGFKHDRHFGRRSKTSKKELRQRRENQKIESENNLRDIIKYCTSFSDPQDILKIHNEGTASFFGEVSFPLNKIHIIRGSNGQGKSTLLYNIANSLAANSLSSIKDRMKVVSNNKDIANAFNPSLEFSPFKMAEDSMFISSFNTNLSNIKNSIAIYCDFTISFFREGSGDIAFDIIEEYDSHSNGERKISGINNVFSLIKFISKCEESENNLNIILILDEPESGLSLEIQEEFYKKIKRYLNLYIKSQKLSLTIIIASHSYIWHKERNIVIHSINDFKDNSLKKEHKSVFL